MADEQIKIRIQADAEQFKAVSAAVEKALADIGKQAEITQGKIKSAGNTIKSANQQWTSLALVIQDLPYGFRGIQNNLPALASGIANIAGPAYVAFSALVAVITAYDMGLFGATKTTNEFAKSLSEANKEIKDAVNYSNAQVATLQSLINIGTNLNNSEYTRAAALKEIKNELGKVNKLEADKITNIGQAILAVNLYTEALKAQQLQEATGKKIAELQMGLIEKRFLLEKKQRVSKKEFNILQAFLGYTDIQNLESDVLNAETLIRKLETLNESAVKANLSNPYSSFNNSKEIIKGQKAAETAAEKQRKAKEAELAREQKATEYLRNWEIQLNTDIANAQVKEGERQTKLREDRLKKEKEDYNNNLSYFDQYYNNLLDFATNDKNAQKEILAQKNNNLLVALANGTIIYDDYIKRVADNTKKVAQLTKAIADEAYNSLLQIGNGLMNALAPSFDMLIEKGASLGEVLTNAFQSILKQLAKVVATALAAVILISILFPEKLAAAGGFNKVLGGLIGQGMGLGGLIGGGATSNAVNATSGTNAIDNLQSNLPNQDGGSFVLRGNDLVLALNRSENSLNLRRGV